MLAYVATPGCRMAFLRAALDDPALPEGWRCGRCDRCTGEVADDVPASADVDAARTALAVPGVELPPRRQWPSGMAALGVDVSGRIGAADGAETGRAVARLDGLGWGGLLRQLFAVSQDGPSDGPLPVALRAPVTEVLDAWRSGLAEPFDAVVAIGSSGRPVLTEHLATGVARHLGVPLLGVLEPDTSRASRHDVNSAQRLADVVRRLGASVRRLPVVLLANDAGERVWTASFYRIGDKTYIGAARAKAAATLLRWRKAAWARDASTNSFSRSDSTWLRTRRDMPAHPTTERAMKILSRPRPSANMTAIAKSRSGKAKRTSAVRMISRSIQRP